MTPRPFIRKITEELDNFRGTVCPEGLPEGEWTHGVHTALAKAGKHFGYRVAASKVPDCDRDWGEWLYDVTWFDRWMTEGMPWSVPMVAECEWGNVGDIQDDFGKLLIARAALRVMVYDGSRLKPEKLCEWVDLFEGTQVGDTYFLATYEGEGPLRYRQIVVRALGAELVEQNKAGEHQ